VVKTAFLQKGCVSGHEIHKLNPSFLHDRSLSNKDTSFLRIHRHHNGMIYIENNSTCLLGRQDEPW